MANVNYKHYFMAKGYLLMIATSVLRALAWVHRHRFPSLTYLQYVRNHGLYDAYASRYTLPESIFFFQLPVPLKTCFESVNSLVRPHHVKDANYSEYLLHPCISEKWYHTCSRNICTLN